MSRTKDTATFNAEAHNDTVKRMEARHEKVEDVGRQVEYETGYLHPNVDIIDRQTGKGRIRVSHNAMARQGEQFVLKNGISLPIVSAFDGTGSMGGNVAKAFYAVPILNNMLEVIRRRYNPQISSTVWQDVGDRHPVVQMSQFEGDERIAEQLRLLIPDKAGGDPTEDYDLGLAYLLLGTQTDITDFYGLKGYAFVIADEVGRGYVDPIGVRRYLGFDLQMSLNTDEICQRLLEKWHLFYLQVGGSPYTTRWWENKLGKGRVIEVPDADYLAHLQAGLIYCTETAQPSEADLQTFFNTGQSNTISNRERSNIWRWLQPASQYFGAQTHLPNFDQIPMPGDVFANLRDPWPMGHQNNTSGSSPTPPPSTPTEINWSDF